MPPLRNDLVQHWLDVQNALTDTQVEIFGPDPINDPQEFTAEEWAGVGLNMWSRMIGLSIAGYRIMSENVDEFVPVGVPTRTVTTTVEGTDANGNPTTTTTVVTEAVPEV